MNNWYIDRSKNFIHEGLREILSIINESELSGAEMSTAALSGKFAENGTLGNAVGNPNAAFTRFRDHGLIRMNNSIGESAKMYLNRKFTFGELIIDLFIKRFANKDEYPSIRPVVMLCKFFSYMMDMGMDIDDIFITYFECHEYFLPINSYEDVNYDLVEKIVSEREYGEKNNKYSLKHRISLGRNEEINYSIWFNALKQTPLFVYLEDNDNGYTLRPNQKQREFFKYISENANEFKDGDITNNSTLYKYYCNREYGLSEIIAPVIKPDITIQEDNVKTLFEYLFGYDQKVNFDYSTYVKHECFGTYFAFISIPNIAIAKIEEDNPQIADMMYKYVRNMGTYYLDNIDVAYKNVQEQNENGNEDVRMKADNTKDYINWMRAQKKFDGEPYFKENTIMHYVSALKAVSVKFNLISIFSICSVEEFDIIDQKIRENPDFDRFNRNRGNGSLSAGLVAYRKFLSNAEINNVIQLTFPDEKPVTSAWFVGATGHENGEWKDFSEQFIAEGRWENGWDDRFLDEVNSMKPGDRIAIKSSYTKKKGLPFNNNGKTVGVMAIKAVGVITENKQDGKNINVDWSVVEPVKEWYGLGVMRQTVHYVSSTDGHIRKMLLDFTFGSTLQDYSICEEQYSDVETEVDAHEKKVPYNKMDFLNEVFLSDEEYETLKQLLDYKKNIILQGSPGVGKTYLAKRLAYSLMEEQNASRVELVQFHQNYSYEDFIMGYKPDGEGFKLQEGVFYNFCKKAENDGRDHYFIIDEINRGNVSKIFGELMVLLENDKRGVERVKLAYRDEEFTVPANVYIIGMMNTADRSLAIMDYALRRRFSFFEVEPAFAKTGFKNHLIKNGISLEMVSKILQNFTTLNDYISDEKTSGLGSGFRIGHSYFCSKPNCSETTWYDNIVKYEIEPMLEEYWFDEKDKVDDWIGKIK